MQVHHPFYPHQDNNQGFKAEFSRNQKCSSILQLSARCCNCRVIQRGMQCLLGWLGSARDLLFFLHLITLSWHLLNSLSACMQTSGTCSKSQLNCTSFSSTGNYPVSTMLLKCMPNPRTVLEAWVATTGAAGCGQDLSPFQLCSLVFLGISKSGIIIPRSKNHPSVSSMDKQIFL